MPEIVFIKQNRDPMIDYIALMHLLLLFVLALLLPGPDFMIVCSTALTRGAREGIKVAAGIALITGLYALISLMGLSVVFERYHGLIIVLKVCGGIYLLYLGGSLIRGSFSKQRPNPVSDMPLSIKRRSAFTVGVLTCLTNPKAIAFFASIFSMALTPATTLATKGALLCALPLIALCWFVLVALGMSRSALRQRYEKGRKFMDRFVGGVISLFGVRMVFSANN